MINALVDRSDYPCLKDYAYLNQASLGLIGQPAVQSMHDFLDDTARHGNLGMTDEEEAGFFESLRQRGARLLNCRSDELAIAASASELLGQLPFLIRPGAGSSIVAVATDFPAVTRPWIRYAAENDCSLRFVDDIAGENLTDRVIDSIDSRTSVVAVSSVQFSTGSMVDVPRLREACAREGARLVVDATQAAGILEIDAKRWRADAVVTSGYKWLGGHGGVALAAVSPALLEQDPLLPGWMGTPHPFDFEATTLRFAAECETLHAVDDVLRLDGRTRDGTRPVAGCGTRPTRGAFARALRQADPGRTCARMDAIPGAGGRLGITPHRVARPPGRRRGQGDRRVAPQPHRVRRSQRSHQGLTRALQRQCGCRCHDRFDGCLVRTRTARSRSIWNRPPLALGG